MTRVNAGHENSYMSSLLDSKGQPPPQFDDTSRGVLIALIRDRPTIWNSSAKLVKDDVIASFQQCSAILSNMDSSYTLWVIIEKWCWVVESYVRCHYLNPPVEWRYNNTLDFLKPFKAPNYPYMGCLSKQRRDQLTKMYGDLETIKVMELTENLELPVGIFRDEMAQFAGEEIIKSEIDLMSRTVGQVVNAKRRGRPTKNRSPTDQFTNLTPHSAQFQKLLDANLPPSELGQADEFGFTLGMYNFLVDIIHEKPAIWNSEHQQEDDEQTEEQLFEKVAKELTVKFKGLVDDSQLDKMTGPFIKTVWNSMQEKYRDEESVISLPKWRKTLHILSHKLMPPFALENVFIKSEDPSTSAGLTSGGNVASSSPTGSSQSEDSRMATSSPATNTQFTPMPGMSNGSKSIQTVLDNLVARSLKEGSAEYSELKHILEQKKTDNDNGPAAKRLKQNGSPPRTILYNDGRKVPQAPISTWVPPREDLTSKVKEEPSIQTPKKAQATAVIKSGIPLEKQLKKLQQQNAATLIPVTSASLQSRTNLLGLTPMVLPQSAIQQALLKKMDTSSPMASISLSSQPTQVLMNGGMNGNSDDCKWNFLGKLVTTVAREVESRDQLAACELFRDLQQVLYQYQIKSLQPKESNSQLKPGSL
ncbi:unnamed protein product [Caenorhabditis sp. 36 PRJEB53466]|nr:unnamed protein product [Caenorhabditis sp. 36 PRJEB53466]